MIKKGLWLVMVALAIGIGFYPGMYFFMEKSFGLLNTKSEALLSNPIWNFGFNTHIILGGVALLVGWTQFGSKFRNKNLKIHRRLGMVYVGSVFFSALAGIYIAFYATGGFIPTLGFIGLGVTWFFTTSMAFIAIKKKQVNSHQKWMIYSYATCFAAVTLRIWLPLLSAYFGNFITAYSIVAFLCWIPNLIVAHFIIRSLKDRKGIRAVKVA